jgi:hypothetical protein
MDYTALSAVIPLKILFYSRIFVPPKSYNLNMTVQIDKPPSIAWGRSVDKAE